MPVRRRHSNGVRRAASWVTTTATSALAVVALAALAALAPAAAASNPKSLLLHPSLYRQVLDVELNRHVEELGRVTDSDNGTTTSDRVVLTRTYMSPAHRAAARRVLGWLKEAGASRSWVDPVGNVHGHFEGEDPLAPVLVAGSHYDTVVDGGKYDGAMGVLVAVAAAKALALEAAAAAAATSSSPSSSSTSPSPSPFSSSLLADGSAWSPERLGGPDVSVPRPPPLRSGGLRVVAFADEEGIRFRSTFLGSRALAGTLARRHTAQLGARDARGVTLAEAIAQGMMVDDQGRKVEEEEQQQQQQEEEQRGGEKGEDGAAAASRRPPPSITPPTRADVERAVLERASLTRTGSPGGASKYVEVHIEQGPVLESLGEPLGVVSGIAGQTWLAVSVEGGQAHAGATPMRARLRRDALAAAAEVVVAIERLCGGGVGVGVGGGGGGGGSAEGRPTLKRGGAEEEGLVCTVGALTVQPGQVNVVPGRADFSVDVRSATDAHRARALAAIEGLIEGVCSARRVGCEVRTTHDAAAVRSDAGVVDGLRAALAESRREWEQGVLAATTGGGGSFGAGRAGGRRASFAAAAAWVRGLLRRRVPASPAAAGAVAGAPPSSSSPSSVGAEKNEPPPPPAVPVLLSGAGHDAMAMAEVAPVGMVFVRCRGGLSHNPDEYASPEDVARSAHALLTYFRRELLLLPPGVGSAAGREEEDDEERAAVAMAAGGGRTGGAAGEL